MKDDAPLLDAVTARTDDLVALTRDLIRIPTLNPPGRNYREICDYLAARLEKRGFAVELVRATGALADSDRHPRWNLVARIEGTGGPGDCVHFNGHHDVVEAGHGWTVDPFGGEVRDGRVYGRGACDMKGGIASAVIAAEAFVDIHPGFRGAIEISATADEESGGFGGVAYLAEQGYFDPARVQHVIIPEPLNKDRICLGHRGVWWAEIETQGRIAHGSMPFLGDCAVRHMGAVLAEMEETLFPLLAGKRTEMPVVPDGARQSTLNINAIHGGEPEQEDGYTGLPAPCVPDRCRITIDRRFLIEEDLGEVKAEIASLMERVRARRPELKYEIRDLFEVRPTMTDRDAPVVRTVEAAIARVLDRHAQFVVSPGTYDQKHIDRIGRLKNCIAYGPGILDLAHQPDEWVGIDDMADAAKVMALTLKELLA
ncbi:acetylornithine deacetylase/succinyl-diaminopimelate desuccinylase family protein [Roseibacterium sp. SDUM158017]|uniref:acetylornithine deacetylase/succinyl-diaminopimelate desuccinylase family protein n=1 Tax=Roseicyclus salinarum TaxID=3036773 RepID=UPI0024150A90|nr:acetylornithine deacetylase/succinyl-diaminopimelate desuccinylase family protein [Roseibacterium sp. SDUM158017]MDG4649898.1 acetylornithine deacetylase/succinyl-diaminopimelate desuccinylase family protein [Roseibacterium sp. SDUM158017]